MQAREAARWCSTQALAALASARPDQMCSGSGTLGLAESDDLEFSSTACMGDLSRDVERWALVISVGEEVVGGGV